MAVIARSNPESQIGTIVPAELFVNNSDAQFWLGTVATGNVMHIPEPYYDGLMRFRGSVYVDELRFLGRNSLDSKGREIDEYDDHSVEIAVIEHDPISSDTAEVVGSTRLILKSEADQELPIEHYFPELFSDGPLSVGSVEVSRFIARHPEKEKQHSIMKALLRTITLHSVENDVDSLYFMIEKPLVTLFKYLHIPMELIGEPKNVPELNGVLYPIRSDPRKMLSLVMSGEETRGDFKKYFEGSASKTGEGYYPESLIAGE